MPASPVAALDRAIAQLAAPPDELRQHAKTCEMLLHRRDVSAAGAVVPPLKQTKQWLSRCRNRPGASQMPTCGGTFRTESPEASWVSSSVLIAGTVGGCCCARRETR